LRRESVVREPLPASGWEPSGGWSSLLDGLDGIIWEADPHSFRFRYVSAGAERLLGYPLSDWYEGEDFWLRLLVEEDREEALRYCLAMLEVQRDHQLVYRVRHRDGRVLWLRDIVTVVRDASGRTVALRGMMMDISDLKETEEVLRSEREQHALLSDHALDLVSLHEPDGRFLFASAACREITGYEPEELIGRPLEQLIYPEDLPPLMAAVQDVLEGRPAQAIVFRVVRRSGELRWCETKGSLAPSPLPGAPPHLVGVTRDISERKVLQDELERAQRLEAIGRLAGGIAHDFNNLLTVIRGHLDFLREGLPHYPQLVGDLDAMDEAVGRAASITRQLLTFGRRDPGQTADIDLVESIRALAELLRRLAGEQITLLIRTGEGALPVRVDRTRLEQILVNLVLNARDAIRGGGTVTLECEHRRVGAHDLALLHGIDEGEYALLRITDTGEGMDAGTLSRIFEPFFSTKDPERGTGLGLAIVYGVVREAGGHVMVESEPGGGTTFQLWFPLAGRSAVDPAGGTTSPPELIARGSGETILLVEEASGSREMLLTILERSGYRVLATRSIEDGLATFLTYRGPIDALLVELELSGGSGLELADRLRAELPALPVILLSPLGTGSTGESESFPPGMVPLRRPFSQDTLLAVLRDALRAPAP